MPWSRICVHYYAHYTHILLYLFAEHFHIILGDLYTAVFFELSGLSCSDQTAVITLGLQHFESRLIGGKSKILCHIKTLESHVEYLKDL